MTRRLQDPEIEELIERLLKTQFPYEVESILDEVTDDKDLVIIVGAALARSVQKGRIEGREQAKQQVRERLGL